MTEQDKIDIKNFTLTDLRDSISEIAFTGSVRRDRVFVSDKIGNDVTPGVQFLGIDKLINTGYSNVKQEKDTND